MTMSFFRFQHPSHLLREVGLDERCYHAFAQPRLKDEGSIGTRPLMPDNSRRDEPHWVNLRAKP